VRPCWELLGKSGGTFGHIEGCYSVLRSYEEFLVLGT